MTTAEKHDYSAKTQGSQADIIARNLADASVWQPLIPAPSLRPASEPRTRRTFAAEKGGTRFRLPAGKAGAAD